MLTSLQVKLLVELLLKMFSPDELRHFLLSMPQTDTIAHHLPAQQSTPYNIAYACVEAMDRRRLLDDDPFFFHALIEERPNYKEDILLARNALQPSASDIQTDEAQHNRALQKIENARALSQKYSPADRWRGWKELAEAIPMLQQGNGPTLQERIDVDSILRNVRVSADQISHLLWGKTSTREELDQKEKEELRDLLLQEQRTNNLRRSIQTLSWKFVKRIFCGDKLQDAMVRWHLSYSERQQVPLPETIDIITSGLVRWTRFQLLHIGFALIGAPLFFYQLYLLQTDISNQQELIQTQRLQFESEENESQEFRRTTLYQTLFNSEPCPNEHPCPVFDRRSRQEAARSLLQIDRRQGAGTLDWAGVLLSEVQLTKADLQNIAFDGADLTDAYLVGSDLRGGSFTGAYMDRINLIDANLQGVSLYKASLRNADLQNADLHGVNARDSDFTDANLTEADLTDARLDNAVLDRAHAVRLKGCPATLPGDGWQCLTVPGAERLLAGPGADLSATDLSNVDLSQVDLTSALYSRTTQWPEGLVPEDRGAVLVDE